MPQQERKTQKVPHFNHRPYVHSFIISPNRIITVGFAFSYLSAPPFCDVEHQALELIN
jgi:hypothetical protein